MFIYSAFADEISPNLQVQIDELKKVGINHIETRGINGKNISDYSVSEIKEVKKILDYEGFKISALGSPIGKVDITESFEAELDKFKNTLCLADILETKYIRMFSFFMDTKNAERYRDEVLTRWEKYIEAAKCCNVILLHENEKGIYGDTAKRCLDLLETLNCNYVKATFDPANFVQCGQDTLEAYNLLEKYVEYFHVKDAKFSNKEVVPAGYGDGNLQEIFQKLYDKNWNGFLSLEPHLGNFIGFSELENGDKNLKGNSDADKFGIAYDALNKIIEGLKK